MSIVASPSLTVIDRFHCCYSITFLCMPSVMNGTWHTKRKFDMYSTQMAKKKFYHYARLTFRIFVKWEGGVKSDNR